MSALGRITTMSLNATWRTYLSPNNLMWIVGIPIILSFVISLWIGGGDGFSRSSEWLAFETPKGDLASGEYPKVSIVFGVYLIFVLSALLTRAGTIHEETTKGTLQRTLAAGVPQWEIIAAHAASLVLVGLVQAVVFIVVTGALGTPWLATGWISVVLPVLGVIVATAGLAIAVAGLVQSSGLIQVIGGGGPSILALLGGAFFPLEVAPAGVQRLAPVNPVYWAVEALAGGFVYDGFSSQATPLAVLLLIGVTGMVIGVQGLRRHEM